MKTRYTPPTRGRQTNKIQRRAGESLPLLTSQATASVGVAEAGEPSLGTRTSVADDSDLNGPDISDEQPEPVEVVGDEVAIWAEQLVNRWVFLKHQRPAALKELLELIAHVRSEASRS
jgi:hypothetical protein